MGQRAKNGHSGQAYWLQWSQRILLLWGCLMAAGPVISQNRPVPELQLQRDTLTFDFRAVQSPGSRLYITHLADFDGHWYVMIKERDPFPFGTDHFRLFVFDRQGLMQHELPLPEEVRSRTIYLDLYVENSQLQLLPYMHNRSYRFDLAKKRWSESRKRSDLVYEDAQFRVYYRDYGEWGSCSWFIDKKTNKQYLTPYATERLTRFKGQYYIDNDNVLTLIADPRALLPSPRAYRYPKRPTPSVFGPLKPQGELDLWRDTTETDYFSFDTTQLRLHRSWVAGGQLLHVINDSSRWWVARRTAGDWERLLDLGPKRFYSRWNYAYRGLNPTDSTRLLFYRHQNDFKYDVLRIQNQHLQLQHWQVLFDTLLYQHLAQWDAYFDLLDSPSVSFDQVARAEAGRGSTDMRSSRRGNKVGYYLLPFQPHAEQFTQMYRTVIDSVLTIRTEHTFLAADSTWLGSRIEFIQSRPYHSSNFFDLFADKTPITQAFDSLQTALMTEIDVHYGANSCSEPAGKGQFCTEWFTPQGGRLRLEGRTDFNSWARFLLVLQAAPGNK